MGGYNTGRECGIDLKIILLQVLTQLLGDFKMASHSMLSGFFVKLAPDIRRAMSRRVKLNVKLIERY